MSSSTSSLRDGVKIKNVPTLVNIFTKPPPLKMFTSVGTLFHFRRKIQFSGSDLQEFSFKNHREIQDSSPCLLKYFPPAAGKIIAFCPWPTARGTSKVFPKSWPKSQGGGHNLNRWFNVFGRNENRYCRFRDIWIFLMAFIFFLKN